MSTKIYEAYKVKSLTISELMDYFKLIREEYIKECVEFVKRTKGDKEFGDIGNRIRKSMSSSLNDPYNFTASIMVYFHEDNIYVQFFGMDFRESTSLGELRQNHLEDYHYQDQSDPWYAYDYDEGKLTEEERDNAEIEYEERKRVWEDIYGDNWRPNECGLVFEVCAKTDYHIILYKSFDMEI